MSDKKTSADFNLATDKVIKKYNNVLIVGDLNSHMLDDNKSSDLNDSCDICCMKKMNKNQPTLQEILNQLFLMLF